MTAEAPAHMGDLFAPDPDQWGLRGDPWVWAAMRQQLHDQPIPPTDEQVRGVIAASFFELVGIDATQPRLPEDQHQVYRKEFAHGGMSSGGVAVTWWHDVGLPLLVTRAAEQRGATT